MDIVMRFLKLVVPVLFLFLGVNMILEFYSFWVDVAFVLVCVFLSFFGAKMIRSSDKNIVGLGMVIFILWAIVSPFMAIIAAFALYGGVYGTAFVVMLFLILIMFISGEMKKSDKNPDEDGNLSGNPCVRKVDRVLIKRQLSYQKILKEYLKNDLEFKLRQKPYFESEVEGLSKFYSIYRNGENIGWVGFVINDELDWWLKASSEDFFL